MKKIQTGIFLSTNCMINDAQTWEIAGRPSPTRRQRLVESKPSSLIGIEFATREKEGTEATKDVKCHEDWAVQRALLPLAFFFQRVISLVPSATCILSKKS